MSSTDDICNIKLDSTQKELIMDNLDDDGKLSCIKAFKVARLIGVDPSLMSMVTKSLNVKITNCELGVFGKLKFKPANIEIYNNLRVNYKNQKKIKCEALWNEAKNSSLRLVGSTVKHSDIEVTHCKLGCFVMRKGLRSGSKS